MTERASESVPVTARHGGLAQRAGTPGMPPGGGISRTTMAGLRRRLRAAQAG
jgi:hypothetical protein